MTPCFYFTGLSWQIDDAALAAACAPMGVVTRAHVLRDPLTGRTTGQAFVTFHGAAEMAAAPATIEGRAVRAHPALERRPDGLRGFAHNHGHYTWRLFEDGEQGLFDRSGDPRVNRIDEAKLDDVRTRIRAELWPAGR